MAAEEYDVLRGLWLKARQNPLELLLLGILVIAVITAMVLAILVLVKIDNASTNPVTPATKNSQESSTTTNPTSPTTTSASTARPCTKRIHQDVLVVYDASTATGDLSLFKATNAYLRDTFFASWSIGTAAQVSIVPFPSSDAFHDQSGFGDFGTIRGLNDLQYLMTRQAQLLNTKTVQTSSSSDIISGLNATQKYLIGQLHDRPDARNTAIIFATSANGATDAAEDVIYHMKRSGIFFLTVAVGSAVNCTSLINLATNGAYAFNITDLSNGSDGQTLAQNIHDLLLTIPNGSICS